MKSAIAAVAAAGMYVAMAGFTYGYSYNETYRTCVAEYPDMKNEMTCGSIAELSAHMPSVVWPLYWPGHLARVYFTKGQS